MKKYFFISMAIIALLFTGCKKDDDSSSDDSSTNNDDNTVQTLPVPVTITEDSQSPLTISSFVKTIIGEENSSQKNANATSTTTVEYDGRVILKKTITSGSDVTVLDYYYNNAEKGLLDSIVSTKNQVFDGVVKYTIDNDKIQMIEMYDANRNLSEKDVFSAYDGDKVTQFTIEMDTGAYGMLTMNGIVNYSGDDMTGFVIDGDLGGYPLDGTYSYTYDDKNFSHLNVITKDQPFIFLHNTVSLSSNFQVAGQTSNMQTDYTYTYNSDNYPITSSYTTVSSNGNGSGSSTIEYENK